MLADIETTFIGKPNESWWFSAITGIMFLSQIRTQLGDQWLIQPKYFAYWEYMPIAHCSTYIFYVLERSF